MCASRSSTTSERVSERVSVRVRRLVSYTGMVYTWASDVGLIKQHTALSVRTNVGINVGIFFRVRLVVCACVCCSRSSSRPSRVRLFSLFRLLRAASTFGFYTPPSSLFLMLVPAARARGPIYSRE